MTGTAPAIAMLGTGTMGAPIARDLLRAGYRVRVWNRTPAKAVSLVSDGAQLAASPAEAAASAAVLITMLADGAAVNSVMSGPAGVLHAVGPEAIWVQMSTVGVEWSDRLAELAATHGVSFVDAPVSGSSKPAAEGQLLILAAGPGAVRSRVQPIFDVVGRRTVWLERIGDGSRLKLAINNWMAVMVEGMAETLSLTTTLSLSARWPPTMPWLRGPQWSTGPSPPVFRCGTPRRTRNLRREPHNCTTCDYRSPKRCYRDGTKPSPTVTETPT